MAWVRIHDGAMQNLKVTCLTDSAFRLWIRGLCYCQTALTDGLIPRSALLEMGAKRRDVLMLSAVLVDDRAPLWDTVDGFGFKVHDYLAWNDSREKVKERQAEAKKRKEEYDARKKAEKEAARLARLNAVPNALRNAS